MKLVYVITIGMIVTLQYSLNPWYNVDLLYA